MIDDSFINWTALAVDYEPLSNQDFSDMTIVELGATLEMSQPFGWSRVLIDPVNTESGVAVALLVEDYREG